MLMNNTEKMARKTNNTVSQGRQLRMERRQKDKEQGRRQHKYRKEVELCNNSFNDFVFAC